METALSSLDAGYEENRGDRGYKRYFVASALWPAIEYEMLNGTSFQESVSKILDEEGKTYVYWRTERRELEEFFSVEYRLTHPQGLQPASALVSSPYCPAAFELLKVRVNVNPSLIGALAFWTRRIPYDADVLKGLQRTENFQRAAIEHIFMGEIKDGAASGYHYARIKGARGYILPSTKEYLDDFGS